MTDPVVWLRRVGAGLVLALGWLFILWANNFHVEAPVVFSCLGYLAAVVIVYNLWRTGAAVAAPASASGEDDSWDRPVGARGELEKEKRSLLKAIKEAEFDREMGKLSQADADAMIRMFRTRAIEVLKELERLEAGEAGSVRERIEREVQARLEVDAEASRAASKKKDKKPAPKGAAKAAKAEAEKKPEPKVEPEAETKEPKPEPVAEATATPAVAVEPPGDDSKEATP